MGKIYVDNVHVTFSDDLTLNLGDLLMIGVTLALTAIFASVDANERIRNANNVFVSSILSGISGIFCLIGYILYAVGTKKINQNIADYWMLREVSSVGVTVTVVLSLSCYVILYKAREAIVAGDGGRDD